MGRGAKIIEGGAAISLSLCLAATACTTDPEPPDPLNALPDGDGEGEDEPGNTGPADAVVGPADGEGLHIVTASEGNDILEIDLDDGRLSVDADDQWWSKIDEGDRLVFDITAATPEGWLRRVTSASTAAGVRTFETEATTLTDIVERGSVSLQADLGPEDTAELESLPGVQLGSPNLAPDAGSLAKTFVVHFDNVVVYDADKDHGTADDQLRLSGEMDFSMSMDLDFDVGWFSIDSVHFGTGAEVNNSLDVFVGGLPGGLHLPSLAKWKLHPIVVFVGVVPVVVVPQVELLVRFDRFGLPLNANASFDSHMQFEIGADYQDGEWTPYAEHSLGFDAPAPEIETFAGGQIRANVGPKLSLMVYGLAGPAVHAGPYLQLDADAQTETWSLYGGLAARVMADFGGFHSKIGFAPTFEVADINTLLASGSYPGSEPDNGASTCCTDHDDPGCDDPAVQTCVCTEDPFCCENFWDAICVSEVDSLGCGTC